MSAKSVIQKLMVKPGSRLLLLNVPAGHAGQLGEVPAGVTVASTLAGPADVILSFVTSRQELVEQLAALKAALASGGRLWIAYPKGRAELHRDIIREVARGAGLEGVAIFAIDDTWAALRLKEA